mmetsp:Transcript_90522/g.156979  ORF Transcript_90522/g.156979 Transcript_90522/m.156979 type:complete len:590 (+) Transcript_90522:74-1843(+)
MAPILATDTIKRLSVERTSLSTVGFSPPSSPTENPAAATGSSGAQSASTPSPTTSPITAPSPPSPEPKRAAAHLPSDVKRAPSAPTSPAPGESPRWSPEPQQSRPKSAVTQSILQPVPKKRGRRFKLMDVPENPQKPLELAMKLKTARDRSSELQDIFTSRCSEETDRLRAHLASLAMQSAELRARIGALERELQEVNAQRLNDTHRSGDEEQHREAPLTISVKREDPLEALQSRLVALEEQSPSSLSPSPQASARSSAVKPGRPQLTLDKDDEEASASEARDEQSHLAELDAEVAFGLGVPPIETEQVRPDFLNLPAPQEALPPVQDGMSSRRQSGSNYQEEVLAHVLQRRRAEARFREVSSVHENSITQMENEQKEIERRMQKQQNWMKHIDEQVLKAEITKTKYHIRLTSAQKRVKSMGEELSKAYENMASLLEERLQVEDMATHNEALVAYLHVMGQADASNDSHFIANKKELLSLLETSRRAQKMHSYTEELENEVRHMQTLVSEAVKETEDMQRLADSLHQLWNIIPVDWKDSVFKHVQKGFMAPLAMHPVNAIQALQTAAAAIHAAQKQYYRSLSEFLPRQE